MAARCAVFTCTHPVRIATHSHGCLHTVIVVGELTETLPAHDWFESGRTYCPTPLDDDTPPYAKNNRDILLAHVEIEPRQITL